MRSLAKSMIWAISILSVQVWAEPPQTATSSRDALITRLRDGFDVSKDASTQKPYSELKAALSRVNHPGLNAIIEKQSSQIIWKPASPSSQAYQGTIPEKTPHGQEIIQYDIESSRPVRRIVETQFNRLKEQDKPRALMHAILTSADPSGKVSSDVPPFKNKKIYDIIQATFNSDADPEKNRERISASLKALGFQEAPAPLTAQPSQSGSGGTSRRKAEANSAAP